MRARSCSAETRASSSSSSGSGGGVPAGRSDGAGGDGPGRCRSGPGRSTAMAWLDTAGARCGGSKGAGLGGRVGSQQAGACCSGASRDCSSCKPVGYGPRPLPWRPPVPRLPCPCPCRSALHESSAPLRNLRRQRGGSMYKSEATRGRLRTCPRALVGAARSFRVV